MTDLSRLLGGLYEPADDGDDPDVAGAPNWHADEQLDAAFENWVPGPAGDASDRERGLFAEAQAGPATIAPTSSAFEATAPATRVDADERVASRELSTEAWPVEAPSAPEAELAINGDASGESMASPAWRPEDDDILPTHAARRFFSLRR